MATVPISVVIPTYNRPDQLLIALEKIYQCDPMPDEIIIHIDTGDNITRPVLSSSFSKNIQVLQSDTQMGPGGGRNCAIAAAKNELIASFDDDSYPLDNNYFLRLTQLFEMFPQAAVIGANIFHLDEAILPADLSATWVPDFVGCGCAYRKSAFKQTSGYVPLAVAYGMEEVDVALQLKNAGWQILHSPWLRVFHNTRLTHHSKPKVTTASIANLALLAYLRYPVVYWWLGIGQCLSRIIWLIKHNRTNGIVKGILSIPWLIYQHHRSRQPISADTLQLHLQMHRADQSAIDIEKALNHLSTITHEIAFGSNGP